ncbi:TTN [Lepeophtheirus salmonis]|uniref:TTN n=1 Tax=Lepeophtheirus salmonis TaxID=72036 RepID=A0A7R8D6J8_LEPSM|nr:TTN [Lepeophtheirus salmonis]CAF2991824.1 TTN [Lepeophtheirus salmonis]
MRIEWFKDGKPITASSRIGTIFNFGYVSLNINGVRSEDAGTYTCRATNITGEAVTNSTLQVKITQDLTASTGINEQQQYIEKVQQLEEYQSSKSIKRLDSIVEPASPPEFKTQLKDQVDIREGGFAHFEARLEPMGDHTMRVEWRKRRTTITALDAGRYTCTAYNGKGNVETSASLTTSSRVDPEFQSKSWSSIQQMETSKKSASTTFAQHETTSVPQFVSQLKGTNIILEGQRAHFECRIEPQNDPKLMVEWLSQWHVKREDAGVYSLIVKNTLGELKTDVELRVDTHADSVDHSTIHARTIEETKKFEMKQQHTTVSQGTERLCTSAPAFRTPLQNPQPVLEGQNIHLEARLEPIGDPTMKVEWFFNERSLTVGSRFKTYNDFGFIALDIIGVNAQDQGVYTCKASNQLGSSHTSANVEVHTKNSIITETENEAAMQQISYLESSEKFSTKNKGKNVHLEARLLPTGDSTMQVEWTVNGKPLKSGHKIRPAYDFDYVALDLLSVYPEDSVSPTTEIGMDHKTAQNLQRLNLLEQRSAARLSHKHGDLEEELDQFLESPRFVSQPKNVTNISEGKNAHFEAKLEPITDPNLPIHDFGYVALDIVGLISEDSGTYTCRATNLAGTCECQAMLSCKSGQQIISETSNELSQFEMLEQRKMAGKHQIEEETTTQAPVFTTSMKSVEIKEGQRAHFECRIIPVSDPTLKVQWLLNSQPIKQANRIKEGLDFGFVSLDIMQAHPDDAGTYTCRAINRLGEAVNSASLVVKMKETIIKDTLHEGAMNQIHHLEQARVAQTQEEGLTTQIPSFTSVMKDLVLLEGTSAHFEAKLVPIGDPKLRVDWLHNGKPIQASNRMSTLHDFGFVALDLKYTRPEDSGTYTCRAVNTLGETTTSATMQIMSAQHGPMGETMHEDALQKIASLEQKKYVSHVMEEDAVQSAPVFVVPLQGKKQSLLRGQNIHMECRIEPYPDPSLKVEWYHNGKALPFGNRWKTSYDFGFAALDILGCYPEDSGTYTLRATNALGMTESHIDFKVSSRSGLLLDSEHTDALEKIKYLESKRRRMDDQEVIITEAPQFGHVLKDLNLEEGQPAHFETTLTPVNDANMRVEWYCNGKPIPQGHRFRTTYDFGFVALDILYAYPEDNGNYTCIAKNAIGEDSISCNLSVQGKASLLLDTMDRDRLTHLRNLENKPDYKHVEGDAQYTKPVFTTPLNNADAVPEQAHVHLECRLEPVNDPNLIVEWFVGGKAIRTGHRFRMTHDFGYVALDILYAYPEDSGTYMCKASNKLGEAVNTCSVSVIGKQSLLLDSQHAESWQKIQHLESRSHQTKLQVVETPSGPPRFITELMGKTTLTEGQNAHFEAQVEPINDTNLKIEFTHNGKALKQASRIHSLCDFGYVALDIAQLVVDDAGEYICRIYNKHGEVKSKINLSISGRDSLDVSSQRPEGLEKIKELERHKQRDKNEELVTFQKPARLIPIGDPSLRVEWFKDGQLISTGSRINTLHDFGFVSLDIKGLRESDVGIYECRAINSLGGATATATIKVMSKGSLILDSQHPEGMRKITALESSKLRHQISEQESKFERPTFVSTLTGTPEVLEGQRAHMECRVVPLGDSNLKFTWFKNGENLNTGSRIQATHDFGFVTLDIDSCIPEDSGMYTIKAENFAGEASTSFALRVGDKSGIMGDALQPDSLKRIEQLEAQKNQKKKSMDDSIIAQPPVFMQPLKDIGSIAEAQNVHVEASIEPRNDPDLKVEWEFNGKSLSCGSRIKTTLDFGHVQLYINGVRGSDSGLYTCKAINKLGEAVSTTQIKVEESSTISGQSQYPSALDKIKSLEAQKVKKETAEKTYTSPTFIEHLNNVTCAEQDTARFSCQIEPSRDPTLKIDWLLNGKPIPAASRFETRQSLGHAGLDIKECLQSDSGVIQCVVSNKEGKVTSSGTLSVNPIKTSFDQQSPVFTTPLPKEIVVRESETAFRLEAFVEPRKDENLDITWYQNGVPISLSSRTKASVDFGQVVLVVEDLSARDEGVYTCNAKNAYGEATTFTSIKCKGLEGLDLGVKHPKGKAGLDAIAEFEKNIMGKDYCIHEDQEKEEESGTAPKFVTPFFDVSASEGDNALFQARVEPTKDGTIKLEWTHDGRPVEESSRLIKVLSFGMAILEIKNLSRRDFGTYVCSASNKYGSDSLDMKLTSQSHVSSEAPIFTSHIKDVTHLKDGDSVHFECKLTPVHDPELKVEWAFNDKPIQHSSRLKTICDFGFVTLDISGVDSRDSGIYKCRAYNKYGEDTTTATVACEARSGVYYDSLQPSSLEKIKNLETETNTSDHATVEVKDPPKFVTQICEKISISEGQSTHFEAKLSPAEDPNLTIEWFKDGNPLSTGHRFRTFHDFGIVILDILYTYEEDQGLYECRAKNMFGSDVTKGTIECAARSNLILTPQVPGDLKESTLEHISHLESSAKFQYKTSSTFSSGSAPRFTVPIHNIEDLKEAESAHFEGRVVPTDDPNLQIEWFWNGKALKAGSRIRTFCDFGFQRISLGEAVTTATLKCSGKRNLIMDSQLPKGMEGAIDKIAHLEGLGKMRDAPIISDDLGNPPEFLVNLQDLLLAENSLAHFENTAGSRIKTINDFGFVILEVANVLTRDSGNYTCKATNKHDPQVPRTFRSGAESIQKLEERRWKRGEGPLIEELPGHPPKFVTQIKEITLVEVTLVSLFWILTGPSKETLEPTSVEPAINLGVAESRATLQVKSLKDINLDSQLPPGMSMDHLKELEKGKVQSKIEPETEITVPKFITQLESRAVGEGEPAHFNCRVEPKHDPKLDVKWYFNDKELSSGHRFRITHEFGYVALDILYAYPEDEGEYQLPAIQLEQQTPKGMKKSDYYVQMEASMQKYSQEMRLTEEDVYDAEKRQPPRFVTLIKSITDLMEMQSAKFECQLAPVGDPNMKVEWFFNGKPLPFKNRFTPIFDFGYVAMNFGWVYPEDSGEYVCKASNLYGMDETRAIIKTSGKPGIIFESQLPRGMESIEKIRAMESGWQQPQEVQEGDWARFCCRVTGYPKPRVMWLLNGHTVINGSKHKLVYDGMWHFDIPKCRDIDGGKVEVIARNQCGEAYALTHLTIKPRADDFRGVLKHNVKPWYEEDEAEIQRQLEVLRKQSMKQSKRKAKTCEKVRELHNMQKEQELQEQQLTEWQEIARKEKKHAEYANTSHFSSQTTSSPIFTNFLEPLNVKTGTSASFTVTFEGNPPPAVKWFRYGFHIKDTKEFKITTTETSSTLIIVCAKAEDSGIFTCLLLENIGGSSKSSTNLNIVDGESLSSSSQQTSSSIVKTMENKDSSTASSTKTKTMTSSSQSTTTTSSSSSSSGQMKEMRVTRGDTIRVDLQFKDGDKSHLKFLFEGKAMDESKEGVKISVNNDVASLTIEKADPEKAYGML